MKILKNQYPYYDTYILAYPSDLNSVFSLCSTNLLLHLSYISNIIQTLTILPSLRYQNAPFLISWNYNKRTYILELLEIQIPQTSSLLLILVGQNSKDYYFVFNCI